MGNNSIKANKEIYDVTFPRVEFSYARALTPSIFLGVGYKFDNFNITSIKSDGILEQQKALGYNGGVKSNIQLIAFSDTRDNIFSSLQGYYIEVGIQKSLPFLFFDFDYLRYDLDIRHFKQIFKHLTLATQLFVAHANSTAPFFDLPYISSPKIGRGYDDRRIINNNMVSLQSEIRYPIKGRFYGASFVNAIILTSEWSSFFKESVFWSLGTGFRFELDKVERTRLRLDLGFGKSSFNFYLTVNEAF